MPPSSSGDDPERHPERIHGAEHLHLSARALDAHRLRHLRLHLEEMPKFNSISISGYTCRRRERRPTSSSPIRLPTASNMCGRGVAAGLDIDRPCAAAFLLLGHRHELPHGNRQDAPARLLWAKLIRDEFAPKDPSSLALRTHCQTSGWSLAAQDVFNNVTCAHASRRWLPPGPHPVAPHQRARRGARAADRLLGAHRPQHPDLPAAETASPASSIRGRAATTSSLTHDLMHRAWHLIAKWRRSAAWRRPSRPAAQDAHRGGRDRNARPHRLGSSSPSSASTSTAPTGTPRSRSSKWTTGP